MDSRKPLTAEDADFMRSFITCAENCVDDADSQEEEFDRITLGQALRIAHIFEAALSLLTPPPDAAVREAVEYIDDILHYYPDDMEPKFVESKHLRTLLRVAQAPPRLTEEQVEAVKIAETLLTDTMIDYGDCEHDVGHCICKYHSGVFNLRAAFPEVFEGEVGRGK